VLVLVPWVGWRPERAMAKIPSAGGRARAAFTRGEASVTTDIEAFIGQEGRDKAIQEVRKQIDAAGVEYMYYQFVSVTGRIMGKGVPETNW